MTAHLSPEIERWKKYLRRDPTRWLLEGDNPSVQLWYLVDIAHRPEDAPAVRETRERVLYSPAVQSIFAAQSELGNWGRAEQLAQPYYLGTVWNLALLAELGVPRTSPRARRGCEFALQNFQTAEGAFEGLDVVETGYLVSALAYFDRNLDERVRRAARSMLEIQVGDESLAAHAARLWAWRSVWKNERGIAAGAGISLDALLDSIAESIPSAPLTFPPFDAQDPLFILRILAEYGRASDGCAARLVDYVCGKQDDQGRWTLEKSLDEQLVTPLEPAGVPSRWATLNALRVIVHLVNDI